MDQPTRKPRDVWYFFIKFHDSDVDVVESGFDQRFLDRIDPVIGERHVVKLRRIGRKEARSRLMRDSAEGVMPVRVPYAEQVMSAPRQHAMSLTKSRLFLREKHHTELAHDRVESAVCEGKGCGVGGSEVHRFARPELGPGHLKHRRIEVSRCEMHAGR